MSETVKHIPGPWAWVENANGQKCLETLSPRFTNARILRCAKGAGPFTPDRDLIAAAPKLLEVCMRVMQDWHESRGEVFGETINEVATAIKLATEGK